MKAASRAEESVSPKVFCHKNKRTCPAQLPLSKPSHAERSQGELPDQDESSRPWRRINVAGYARAGWSTRGKAEGEGHELGRAFAVWSTSNEKELPDIVFGERTSHFPPKLGEETRLQHQKHAARARRLLILRIAPAGLLSAPRPSPPRTPSLGRRSRPWWLARGSW
eukprot:3842184-Alexandrium_andersonii.AAC.1